MQLRRAASSHSKAFTLAAVGIAALAVSAVVVRALSRRAEEGHAPRGRFLQVGDFSIHYVDRGQGRPVVVLHGNGAMVEELEASQVIQHLSDSHRVIAIDRAGFGLTRRAHRDWSPEQEAQLVLSLIHQLRLERPVIVAHSWSTLVALSIALEEPDATSGLVLVGGYYYPTWRKDVLLQSIISAPLVGDLFRHTVWPLVARAAAPLAFKMLFSPMQPTDRFISEYSVPMATRPSQLAAFADDTVGMPRAAARLSKRYREIQTPVDLIAGADDRMVSTARQSRRLHKELHNSFLDEVPGAGHMVHHAHPELVAQRVAHVFERALTPVSFETGEAVSG